MADKPLMQRATAVWLIDNTSLTFDQIAEFCRLHPLEVQGIADGDVAAGVRGYDPIASGQLMREEIEKAEADPAYRMKLLKPKHNVPEPKRKGPKYTPLSKRQERPDAIMWMVRNHPEISDAQIAKLLGTTKPTIQSIRDRTHWNSANIKPQDPVGLGLCTQMELDAVVKKAAKKRQIMDAAKPKVDEGAALAPTEDAPADEAPAEKEPEVSEKFLQRTPQPAEEEDEPDAESVFGNIGGEKAAT